MRSRSGTRWSAFSGLLLAAVLLGSGCVYWRLYQLRSQLADFDTFFIVTHEPGAVIRFHRPVLKPGDVAWLIGLDPIQSGNTTDSERYTYTFRVRTPGRSPAEESAWDIRVDLTVLDRRIVEIHGPERFNEVLNQETLRRAFRGASGGRVDSKDKATGWALDDELKIPSEGRILTMLGPPVERAETDLHRTLDYRYDLEPVHHPDLPETPELDARFLVERDSGRVVNAFIRIGSLSVRVVDTPDIGYEVMLRR